MPRGRCRVQPTSHVIGAFAVPGGVDTVRLALAVGFVTLRPLDVRPRDQSVNLHEDWRPMQGGSPWVGDLGSYLSSPASEPLFVPLKRLPWPASTRPGRLDRWRRCPGRATGPKPSVDCPG